MIDICTQTNTRMHTIKAHNSSFSELQIMLRPKFLPFNSDVTVSIVSKEQK